MPEPVAAGRRYIPGLDGLRAVAVLGVIAYHLGLRWVPGGLLGVGVFFTLSGYLITDILLTDALRDGIRLTSFWRARARRLLPALFSMLLVVTVWVTVIGPHQPPDYRGAVASGVFYVNNWWLILHHVSYFQAFATPPPLNHLWSLAVEEQFYLLWPLVLVGALGLAGRRNRRLKLAVLALALTVESTVLMAVLYHPGIDPSRVYYGTDTRASELFAGAVLAALWPSRRLHGAIAPGARRLVDGAGAVGLLMIGVLFWRSQQYAPFLYRGGFLLLSGATVAAIAALVHPGCRLGGLVGCAPLRWVGERSYGLYLWHFPIIVLTARGEFHHFVAWRALLQLIASIAVASASWRWLEDPIRHGALGRLAARIRARGRPFSRTDRAWMAAAAGLVIVAAVGLAGPGVDASASRTPGNVSVSKTVRAAATGPARARRVSCHGVVHIGDSTSEGLVSADYLPRARWRISARYARVGAVVQHFEISGARSIYERYQGLPNAQDVAAAWRQRGFRGCWVLALGTNEAADFAAGSKVDPDQRIDMMMATIGTQPVLWTTVRSLLTDGPYAEENMKLWNSALLRACGRYPNMRVYDWAADVKNRWFIPDGIHFTTAGYRARARLLAHALLAAFPAGGVSQGCVVQPDAP